MFCNVKIKMQKRYLCIYIFSDKKKQRIFLFPHFFLTFCWFCVCWQGREGTVLLNLWFSYIISQKKMKILIFGLLQHFLWQLEHLCIYVIFLVKLQTKVELRKQFSAAEKHLHCVIAVMSVLQSNFSFFFSFFF